MYLKHASIGGVSGGLIGFILGVILGMFIEWVASLLFGEVDIINTVVYFFLMLGIFLGMALGISIAEDEELSKNKPTNTLVVSARKAGFFTIKIDGNIESLNTYKNTKQIIKITDTTDDDKVIVYTNTSPFDTSNLIGELECIPRENLNLVQGKRKLQFKYTIVDITSGETIKTLSATKTYTTLVIGRKSTQKKQSKKVKQIVTSDELMIQTAFYMSNIDGNIDELEGKTITTLGKKLLENKNSKDQYVKNKDKINTYIKNAQKDVKNNSINIDKVLIEINKKCTLEEKNFLFETCLYIAAADGVTDKSELDFINYLVRKMDLNKPKSKSLIEKILPTNEDNKKKEDKKFAKSLGITSGMSNQVILEILKKEYRKWNQRVGLSDSSKREQAESMLHKISELRKKYRN